MTPSGTTTPRIRIRIRMERSYSEFNEEQRQKFLNDLSELSGCPVDEFHDVIFRKGCVIFETEVDVATAEWLIEMYARRKTANPTTDDSIFRQYMESYS